MAISIIKEDIGKALALEVSLVANVQRKYYKSFTRKEISFFI